MIKNIFLQQHRIKNLSPIVENEQKIAILDLLAENSFELVFNQAPTYKVEDGYHLYLSIQDHKLHIDIKNKDDQDLHKLYLPLMTFKSIVKDYFIVCESYYQAIQDCQAAKIRTLDMGRRSIHNEGAEILKESLHGKVTMDHNTARRLFTLLCVLHIRSI
ncbi:MAG: UPF0262 family protein [Alphaproteobacteria bacterium]|nr:UPF0262 family protein [Alphaproteobacteria bacterium]MBP9878237.1 UPF0262 family protein [Alphaproteobacteria bacterium]